MDYAYVRDPAEIRKYLSGASRVAFDFETAPDSQWRDDEKAALDAHRSHIVGVSLSVAPGTAIYVPLHHQDGGNADPDVVIPLLTELVWRNPNVIKIAHNLSFEAMFLYSLGIVLAEPLYDTIAAAQMTLKSEYEFRGLHDCGLKKLVPEIYGDELPTFTEVTGGHYFDELLSYDSETVRYACADSDYALRLYFTFNTWFADYLPRHRYIVEAIESPTAVFTGLMKYNGVPMDVHAMNEASDRCIEHLGEIRQQIMQFTGGIKIGNNCSTNEFKDYLFGTLGLPVLVHTDGGKPAIDDPAMILLREWCEENKPEIVPLFGLVEEYRKWSKVYTTYVVGYLRSLNKATMRIHPDLMPLATETGRFACRNPNLQNQIAPGADPVGVRNFVTAGEGNVLLEADYSQVEMRLAAYLSEDSTMLEAYRSGADIHAITTSAVFGISIDEAKDKGDPDYKHRRTVAKGTMFGILYGIGPGGLARNLKYKAGVDQTPEQCAEYINGILRRYDHLGPWQRSMVNAARKYGFVQTRLGRRRYLPDIRSRDYGKRSGAERMAMNTPVQGLAADILKLSMGRLVTEIAANPWLKPIMTVHDSIVFEIPEDKAEEATVIVKRCMEAMPPLPDFLPLIAEVGIGKRYGELE